MRFLRPIVLSCGVLLFAVSSHSQNDLASADPELTAEIAAFKNSVLTTVCVSANGDVAEYYLGPIPMPVLVCGGTESSRQHCAVLIGLTGAAPGVKGKPNVGWSSARVTVADELNGIQQHGYITLDYAASRSRTRLDGKWGEWTKFTDKKSQTRERIGELIKSRGAWSVRIGEDLQTNPYWLRALAPGANMTLDILKKAKLSCDVIQERQQPNAARQRFNDLMNADAAAATAAPQFHGSADEFARRLPELVQVFARANGLDPESYLKETAYIASNIRTCLKITDDMAASVKDFMGRPDLLKLGKEYQDCSFGIHNVTSSVDPNWRTKKPFMGYFQKTPVSSGRVNLVDQRWSAGFRISVYFGGVKPMPDYIVIATIDPPSR